MHKISSAVPQTDVFAKTVFPAARSRIRKRYGSGVYGSVYSLKRPAKTAYLHQPILIMILLLICKGPCLLTTDKTINKLNATTFYLNLSNQNCNYDSFLTGIQFLFVTEKWIYMCVHLNGTILACHYVYRRLQVSHFPLSVQALLHGVIGDRSCTGHRRCTAVRRTTFWRIQVSIVFYDDIDFAKSIFYQAWGKMNFCRHIMGAA